MTTVTIKDATYVLPDLDQAGAVAKAGYWMASVAVEAPDGSRTAVDRYDLPASATRGQIIAAVKTRMGVVPDLERVAATATTKLDATAEAREAEHIAAGAPKAAAVEAKAK